MVKGTRFSGWQFLLRASNGGFLATKTMKVTKEYIIEYLEANDLEFGCKDIDYYICPIVEDGKRTYSAGQSGEESIDYKSLDDLFEKMMVGGKPFIEQLDNIELY